MYRTHKRPATEPYEIWKARRRMQVKEIKQYLKGRFVWISSVIVKTEAGPKKYTVQGTYVKPLEDQV